MESLLRSLSDQHAELETMLSNLDEAGWARPTRCPSWDVADVVLHLAQTDELAAASGRGEFSAGLEQLAGGISGATNVDDGAGAMVARERGVPNAELLERWRSNAATLRQVLADRDPRQRVDWVAGQLTVRTLATTRLSECWIHTGDVAEAIGVEQIVDDRLEHIARLAWRTLPYAFARAGREMSGPVAFDLRAPSGAGWKFVPEHAPVTVIDGPGAELCLVAARRVAPDATSLRGTGPDADAVLELVRTYA